jgi:transcriptional regulator with XRE-family HTH domain
MAKSTSSRKRPATPQDLLDVLAAYERTPDAIDYGLRLDLADMIIRRLDSRKWNQQELADRAGVKAPVISRILHTKQNLTIKTLCRILSGLGIKPRLLEFDDTTNSIILMDGTAISLIKAESHGQEERSGISSEGPFRIADYAGTTHARQVFNGRPAKTDVTYASDDMVRFDVSVPAG